MIDYAVIVAIGSPYHQSYLVQDRPHAMLPALGKPMIARMMDKIYDFGIRKFVVVVGVSEGAVASYLNRQWMPDVQIELVFKAQERPMAVVLQEIARRWGKGFLISHYNSFCHANFIPRLMKGHDEQGGRGITLAGAQHLLSSHSHQIYATCEGQGVRKLSHERQDEAGRTGYLVNGLGICGQDVVDYLAQEETQLESWQGHAFTDVVRHYLGHFASGVGFVEASWLLQVESDLDLLILNRKLLDETHDNHILSEIPYTAKIIAPVRIDPRVSIGQDSVIGPHVYLEQGSTVGYGARIRDAIVVDRGSVSAHANITNDIIGRRGSILKS